MHVTHARGANLGLIAPTKGRDIEGRNNRWYASN